MDINNRRHIVILQLLTVLILAAARTQCQTTISNTDHRPLIGALDALENLTGSAINYEDPPYQNDADLQDVSTPQQRASTPGYRLMVPRKGHVNATLQFAGPISEVDKILGVNVLLNSYRNNKLPGDFKVEQANGMLYVVPTKIMGANSAWRDVTSPMATLITVPYGERTGFGAVKAILEAVFRATGIHIEVGNVEFYVTKVSFSANGEPARDVL